FVLNHAGPPTISLLPLHDALPTSGTRRRRRCRWGAASSAAACRTFYRRERRGGCSDLGRPDLRDQRHAVADGRSARATQSLASRSEEHTSELQSLTNLVCRLLLEK